MRCLYCGSELALLKKLAGEGQFCSEVHRQKYQDEFSQLALNRLMQAQVPLVRPDTRDPSKPPTKSPELRDLPPVTAPPPRVFSAPAPPPAAAGVPDPPGPPKLRQAVQAKPAEAKLPPAFSAAAAPERIPTARDIGNTGGVAKRPPTESFRFVSTSPVPTAAISKPPADEGPVSKKTAGYRIYLPQALTTRPGPRGMGDAMLRPLSAAMPAPAKLSMAGFGETESGGVALAEETEEVVIEPDVVAAEPSIEAAEPEAPSDSFSVDAALARLVEASQVASPPVAFTGPGFTFAEVEPPEPKPRSLSGRLRERGLVKPKPAEESVPIPQRITAPVPVMLEPKAVVLPVREARASIRAVTFPMDLEWAESMRAPFALTGKDFFERGAELIASREIVPAASPDKSEAENMADAPAPAQCDVDAPIPAQRGVDAPNQAQCDVDAPSQAQCDVDAPTPAQRAVDAPIPAQPAVDAPIPARFNTLVEQPAPVLLAERRDPVQAPVMFCPVAPKAAPIHLPKAGFLPFRPRFGFGPVPEGSRLPAPEEDSMRMQRQRARAAVDAQVSRPVPVIEQEVKAECWPEPIPRPAYVPLPVEPTPAVAVLKRPEPPPKREPVVAKAREAPLASVAVPAAKIAAMQVEPEAVESFEAPRFAISTPAESSGLPLWIKFALPLVLATAGGGWFFHQSNASAAGSAKVDPAGGSALNVAGWDMEPAEDIMGAARGRKISVYKPSQTMRDYHMRFTGRIQSKAMGWAFRVADLKNYQAMKIELGKPGSATRLLHWAVVDGVQQDLKSIDLPSQSASVSVFNVQLDVRGSKISVHVDNRLVDAWTEPRLKMGGVGFLSERGEQADYQNVRISF